MADLYTYIIIHYKQPKYWKEAILSVLNQDYPAMELIFADDGTAGFNPDEVERFIDDNAHSNLLQYKVIAQHHNVGTVKNLNAAIAQSHGEYIQFLAADDTLFDDCVASKSVAALTLHPDTLAITSSSRMYDETMQENLGEFFPCKVGHRRNAMSNEAYYHDMLTGCIYLASATVYRKETFSKYGLFDEKYRLIEDYPYWVRMAAGGDKIIYIQFCSVKHRMGGVSHPTSTSISPTQLEYSLEELIMLTEYLVPEMPNLSLAQQKRARVVYSFSRDKYNRLSACACVGISDAELDKKLDKTVKANKIASLDRVLEIVKYEKKHSAKYYFSLAGMTFIIYLLSFFLPIGATGTFSIILFAALVGMEVIQIFLYGGITVKQKKREWRNYEND